VTAAAHALHVGIAEAGKLAALKGEHAEALRHYREALRLAHAIRAPEVFFRHYTQCVLESLERSGAQDEVIAFCENADDHYRGLATSTALHARDHGALLERLGVALLRRGDADAARATLTRARDRAGDGALPVAETLLGWLARGLTPDRRRLEPLLRKHRYYTVRPDQVDARRARPLPKGQENATRIMSTG